MTLRNILTITGCFVFCTFIQFLGVLGGWVWAIVAAIATAALFLLLLRFFEVKLQPPWLVLALTVFASAVGIGLGFLGSAADLNMWWAPPISGAVAGVWLIIVARNARECSLCSRRLSPADIAFVCPRCSLLVCEQRCWQFTHQRCRLCEENRVPIFVPDGRWWDRQFGARVKHGRCQVCMKTAEEADLRCCAGCGRPMCRECWDYVNGQCQHCDWLVSDLPPALRPYMLRPGQSGIFPARK
jgi:hypothetical protein